MDNGNGFDGEALRAFDEWLRNLDSGDTPATSDRNWQDFKQGVRDKSEEAVNLLLRKHMDYGPKNIADSPGGPTMGLAVRLHDKVARLAHLLEKGVDPQNESLYDTFMDICNYGLIGMLVLSDMWDKPTGEDK